MIYNSSQIDEPSPRNDIDVIPVPVDQIALELGSPQSANMVALGAYLQKCGLIQPQTAIDCLKDVLATRHHKTIPVNTNAILRGAEFVMQKQ